MKLLCFLLVIFMYLVDNAQAMMSRGDPDYNGHHSDQNQTKREFFPNLSDVESSISVPNSSPPEFFEALSHHQSIMSGFQNQSFRHSRYDYFDKNPRYRKRKLSSQSDVGPMTDNLRNKMNKNSTMFVKRKKTHIQLAPSIIFSAPYDFFGNRLNENNSNQNLNKINSPSNTDNTFDDLQSQPSPITEIINISAEQPLTTTEVVNMSAEQPLTTTEVINMSAEQPLTPTLIIEPELSKSESTIVAETTSTYSTSVLTKSKLNDLQKKSEKNAEEIFRDKFQTLLKKNSELGANISRQTDDFCKEIQSFNSQHNDPNSFQSMLDDNLFRLREKIKSTETLSIKNIGELNYYVFELISKYSKCENQNELQNAKFVVSSTKDILFENLINWVKNSIQMDLQIQNMHSVLLEICQLPQNHDINNIIVFSHLVGMSREILDSKKEINELISSLFEGLKTCSKNLDQMISKNEETNDKNTENQIFGELQSLLGKQSDDLISHSKKFKDLQERFDKLQRKLQKTQELVRQISSEKDQLEGENQRLKKENNISQQQLDNLINKLDKLKKSQKQLEKLQQKLKKADRIYYDNMMLMDVNKSLVREKDMFRKKSNDLMYKLNGLKKVQGELKKLQNEKRINQEKYDKICKENRLLELENQRLKGERNAFQQQLNSLPKTLEKIISGSKNDSESKTRKEKRTQQAESTDMGNDNLFEYCFQINSNCSDNSKISIRNIIN